VVAIDDATASITFDADTLVIVTAVETQGDASDSRWVVAYHLRYSLDGATWFTATRQHCADDDDDLDADVFPGNWDASSIARNTLFEPFAARFVRLRPVKSHGGTKLRWEVHGIAVQRAEDAFAAVVTARPGAGGSDSGA
jgi:hypothetical protein